MKRMELVALDLDGTLLTPGQNISNLTRRVIRQAGEAGVRVIVCSGRIAFSAVRIARSIGLTTPVVAVNGAHVIMPETGETLLTQTMNNELVRHCVEVAEQLNLYSCVFHPFAIYGCQLRYATERYNKLSKDLLGKIPIEVKIEPDVPALLKRVGEGSLKVVIASEDGEALAAARDRLADPRLEITSSWHNNLEIMTKGVNKGSGLGFLSDYYGIPRQQVMAVGDNENDLSMFDYAGWSVAMGNGEPIVKQRADYVTASNRRGGAALAIRRFCLEVA